MCFYYIVLLQPVETYFDRFYLEDYRVVKIFKWTLKKRFYI